MNALPLIDMPPAFDCVAEPSHPELRRTLSWFGKRGFRVVDVPYDGDCTLHSVAPAFAQHLDRATNVDEGRRRVLALAAVSPAFAADLQHELANEKSFGTPGVQTGADLLAYWARRSVYLPPFLVSRATECITGIPVRLWVMGTSVDGECTPEEMHTPTALEGPGPYPPHICVLYVDRLRHMCRIVLHNGNEFWGA